MKKLIFGLLLCIIIFNFVSAEQSGGVLTGKQNNCIQLPQECPSCSYSQLTKVVYPNMSIQVINSLMTKNGTTYNYTFCNTKDLGVYSYCTLADVDGTDTSACKPFEITPSGFIYSTGLYFLIIILSIGIIVLGYYVEDAWIVVLGSFGMVLFGLLVLFYGIAGMKDSVYTWGIGLITLMLGAYFGLKGSLEKLDG